MSDLNKCNKGNEPENVSMSKKVESHSSNSVKEMKVTFQERSLFGKNDLA